MGNTQHKDEGQKRDDSAETQETQEAVVDSEAARDKPRRFHLNKIHTFITLIIVCLCIAVIAVSVAAAISTKVYSATNSGRSVGLVVLDVSAALALTVALFSSLAIWRKHNKQIVLAALALGVLVVAQSVIIGVCVKVQNSDIEIFSKALVESFQLAQQDTLRAVRIWHDTQYKLKCCGVLSAEDYKDRKQPVFFPAEIPISCCPTYDPDRTAFMQERQREMCKLKKSYYKVGCQEKVLLNVAHTEHTLNILVSVLIVFELIEIIWNIVHLIREMKKETKENGENNEKNDEKQGGKELEMQQSKKHSEPSFKTKA